MTNPVILERNVKLPCANRLVVLMPEYPVEVSVLGRLIRDLSNHRITNVLLLSVVKEPFAGVHMANVLGYLYAMTHDPFLHVETSVQADITWLQAIRKACRPGDLFLCLSDHKVPWHIFWHKPIAEMITNRLDAQVYVVSVQNGLYKPGRAGSH